MPRKRTASNGEGSVFKVEKGRHKGKYGAVLTLGRKPDGGLDRQQRLFTTRREADAWLQEQKRERDEGAPIRSSSAAPLTVAAFLEGWLEDVVRPDRSPATYTGYASLMRNHVIPELGPIRLDRLTASHVQTLKAKLRAGHSPATVAHTITILRAALNRARRWGLVKQNVAALVELPAVPLREAQTLDRDAGLRFIEAVRSDRLYALYALDLFLGLRRGEVLALRWQDIDLDAGRLTVDGALQRAGAGSGLVRRQPKNNSRRDIALPRVLVGILRAHQERQQEERASHRHWRGWQVTDYVFTTTYGGPIEPNGLTNQFAKLRARLGLPPTMHFHDLRHSVATMLLEEGVDIKLISKLLGHADSHITREVYIRHTDRLKQQTADKIDELFGEQPEPPEAPAPEHENKAG